jgi:uridine kinase
MRPVSREQLCAYIGEVILHRATAHPLRVAIDGPDCAGKSTLADELAAHLAPTRPVVRVSGDDFHQPAAVRKRRGDLSPDGYYDDAFDLQAIRCHVLQPLGPQGHLRYRSSLYDYRSDEQALSAQETAPAEAVLLFDGMFLLRPELRPHWDLSIYLEVGPDESIRRALSRDLELFGSPENVRRRYTHRYLPAQARYRRDAGPQDVCDVLIDMSIPTDPVLLRLAPT